MIFHVEKDTESRFCLHSSIDQISIGNTVGFVAAMFVLYFFLLGVHHSFLSLNVLLDWIGNHSRKEQAIMIMLVPFYLSILIFGIGVLGGILGNFIQKKWFNRK